MTTNPSVRSPQEEDSELVTYLKTNLRHLIRSEGGRSLTERDLFETLGKEHNLRDAVFSWRDTPDAFKEGFLTYMATKHPSSCGLQGNPIEALRMMKDYEISLDKVPGARDAIKSELQSRMDCLDGGGFLIHFGELERELEEIGLLESVQRNNQEYRRQHSYIN